MLVVIGPEVLSATLNITVDLNRDWADPQMTLAFQEEAYTSRVGGGSFEGELLQIQRQMPLGTYMKCCFNCAFSGYSPYGNGLWGMYCHRNHKEAYVHANDKPE